MSSLTRKLALLAVLAAGCAGTSDLKVGDSVNLVDPETYEFTAARPLGGYRLGMGDQFDVDFLFERTLNTRVKVRPDGYVALPIVGEIPAQGRTPAELDSILTEAYSRYYREPDLTINILSYAPPSVYVLGEVHNPRAVDIVPGMSLIHALAMAQPTERSNMSSVVLLRRLEGGKAYAQRVNAARFLRGQADAWDVMVAPYDIIYVPPTFVAKLSDFVKDFFGGLVPVPLLYLRTWEAFHTDQVYNTVVNRTVDTTPN